MLVLLVPALLAASIEVERVLAVVNGVPVLASDAELAEVAALVPRAGAESDDAYRRAVVEALVQLELRWQDLETAGIAARVKADLDSAWRATVQRAGGEATLDRRLADLGLGEAPLRELVRRAAVVQAYVASRFGTFVRPTAQEIDSAWKTELVPELEKAGKPVPPLAEVRGEVEALLRERKLSAEVERWTADLAKRAEVVRFAGDTAPAPVPAPHASSPTAPPGPG